MAQEQVTTCPQCGKSFPSSVKLCPDDGTVLEHDPTASAPQVGTVLDGKYRLDAFLSRGGMGAVYRATHVMLNRPVAVKLINPELVTSSEIVRRFQREARAATTLSHPNIVSVYDLGQTADGTLYIAMEFVDGPSLKSVIESGGPIPPVRTLAIMQQLASALALAHRRGVIHRDLKPHNVMLARTDDGQQIAKLVDFGIAKTFDEGTQLTMAGFSPGTPQYMAPEQAEGKVVDARSDLYSLGIVLYEMLTGQVPFNATSTASVLIQHIKEAPPPFALRNPRVVVPASLEALTFKCLAKNPTDRFQTADELSAALAHEAASLAASSEAMQATMPMSGAPMLTDIANAATMPLPAAVPPSGTASTAPTAKAQQVSSPSRVSAGTRPTVAPAVIAAAEIPPPQAVKKSNPVLAIVLVLMVVGAGALVYINFLSGRSTPPAASTPTAAAPTVDTPPVPAPAASPAMAPQASQNGQTSGAGGSNGASTSPGPAPKGAESTPVPATSSGSSSSTSAPGASAGRVVAPASRSTQAVPGASGTAATALAAAASGAQGAGAPAATNETAPSQVGEREQARGGFPEIPNVFFDCNGPQAQALCPGLRANVMPALEKAGVINVRIPARADIRIEALVTLVQQKVDRQFDTTFAVRTFTIEINAETRAGEVVPMPAPSTVSFDPQFGAERGVEQARLLSSDIADRVKAFVKRKRGG